MDISVYEQGSGYFFVFCVFILSLDILIFWYAGGVKSCLLFPVSLI